MGGGGRGWGAGCKATGPSNTTIKAIAAQLNKDNRRFYVTGIDKKRRYDDLSPGFDWLANAA
ncbi:hypothetical protein [Arabiibacter massiliensis]|uniref:hypothetical protein n=1 Tax=Arabiibacter massiliensis TaxID=1870985 RepID=UPI001179CA25|nr:hypothetical protein [Arabiibacter massiliensis]